MTKKIAWFFVLCFFACTNVAAQTASAPATAQPAKKVFSYDLADICLGVGNPDTAAYNKTPGKVHPLVVFQKKDINDKYMKSSKQMPSGWEPKWDEMQNAELIVCLVPASRNLAKTCPYDIQGTQYALEMQNTKYDVALYEAKTGKELGKTTFDLKAVPSCPTVKIFSQKKEMEDADYKEELVKWVKTYVQP